jgi:AraC-like DNA-binding protein
VVLLFTAWGRAAARPGGLPEARRARLLALLAEDPARRWEPRALAGELGLSPVHLSRQVRSAFGVPLRRLLVEHRVRAAAADLAEGGAVAAVAARHGWGDPFLFSRQFRQVFGVAPRTWARERGSGP